MAALCRTELVVHRRPARCGEVWMSIGDPRRAAEQLGFTAWTTLTDGLAMTLERLKPDSEVKAQVVVA
jgi:hypothetical protein